MRETCLVLTTRQASNALTRTYNASLAEVGLEVTQFTLLGMIAAERAGSAAELARQIGIERSTLARNLERLIKDGLVTAQSGQGRRVLYRLTDAGRERLVRAITCWEKAQSAMLAALPPGMDAAAREQSRALRAAAQRVSGEVDWN
ncbi:MAG TPA: MarR family winged helix-turn-helix transcriptional regulator [Salinarimonas sp.]|nr:MarR family winged helix-turn-helix transcriptional regulator [Salinarimonas sp.]